MAADDVIGDGDKSVFVFRHREGGGLDCFFRAVHVIVGLLKCIFQSLAFAHAVQNVVQLFARQLVVLYKILDLLLQASK